MTQSFDTAWEDKPAGEQPTTEVQEQTTDESEEVLETPEGTETEEASEEPESTEVVDYKALYEKTKNDLDSATGRYKAKIEELRRNGVVPEEAPPAPAKQAVDPDEEFLSSFQQTYQPEVLRAIDIISKRNAREMTQAYIEQNLTPVAKTTQDLLVQAHFGRIEAAHPDVYAIADSDDFNNWIDSKPVHLRNAYIAVRNEGSPEEVISMLNEYKDFKRPKSAQQIDSHRVGAASAVPRARAGLPAAPAVREKSFDTAWET